MHTPGDKKEVKEEKKSLKVVLWIVLGGLSVIFVGFWVVYFLNPKEPPLEENNVSQTALVRQPSPQYNWERLLKVKVDLTNPNEWSNWYGIGEYNHLRVAPDGCILFRTDKNLNEEEMICTEEELPGNLTRSTKFQFLSRENRPVRVTLSYG